MFILHCFKIKNLINLFLISEKECSCSKWHYQGKSYGSSRQLEQKVSQNSGQKWTGATTSGSSAGEKIYRETHTEGIPKDYQRNRLCECSLDFCLSLDDTFLFVGLDVTCRSFKMRRSENKERKRKMELPSLEPSLDV